MKYTAALEDLLSKSPAYAEDFSESRFKYRAQLRKIRNDLRTNAKFQSRLESLKKAGADPRKIVHFVAIEAAGQTWLNDLRLHKGKMRRLAKRIRTMADKIEQAYQNEATHPDLLDVSQQVVRDGPVLPASKRIPYPLLEQMLACAVDLDAKAAELGIKLKRISPAVTRHPVEELLIHLHWDTGNARKHLGTVSEMLGSTYYTTGSLEKLLDRHALPRLQYALSHRR